MLKPLRVLVAICLPPVWVPLSFHHDYADFPGSEQKIELDAHSRIPLRYPVDRPSPVRGVWRQLMNPRDIGRKKAPEVGDGGESLKNTDQRWFSQLTEAQEDGKLSDPEGLWRGDGYMINEIRRIANEHPETRKHLVPLIRRHS
jgi:hypothetical protein